jgi:hypothetical protein
MEMIDVLRRLQEIAETKPELVKDAVENVERTNPKEVNENPLMALGRVAAKSAGAAAGSTAVNRIADKVLDKQNEGGMSDVHIGAQEEVGEYVDDDGNLKMPKAQVLQAMAAAAKKAPFPQSYEIETAMQIVNDKFDDDGSAKDEMPEPDEVPHDVDTQMNMDAPAQATNPNIDEKTIGQGLPIGTKAFLNMGSKLDINFSRDQAYMVSGVLNRLDQDALLKAVDEYKSQELDPDQAESNELNTEAMTTEDKKPVNESKKPVKEAITMTADSPEEASMLMQIMKLAGVQQVTPDMIGAEEPGAEENPPHGEPGHVCGDNEDDAMGSNDMARMRDVITKPDEEKADETFANSPGDREKDEPKTMDVDTLVNVHSGGLNRQKNQYRKEYPGDNPMAVEDKITEEDLANSLRTQYESFKQAYQEAAKVAEGKAKPDFLDMDKDGDEKESMKKAVKDKEAK